jgi:hypothetical protein
LACQQTLIISISAPVRLHLAGPTSAVSVTGSPSRAASCALSNRTTSYPRKHVVNEHCRKPHCTTRLERSGRRWIVSQANANEERQAECEIVIARARHRLRRFIFRASCFIFVLYGVYYLTLNVGERPYERPPSGSSLGRISNFG